MISQIPFSLDEGITVDLFAGGGGASTGLERALGHVDIAINHDPRAIAMHEVNHPRTKHYHCDVWEVDPAEATQGRPVKALWASPDCTFFSKARGKQPHRDRRFVRRRRALATVVTRWARDVRPSVILMENVEEFLKWGPVDEDGHPIKEKQGVSFNRWAARLRNLGYTVQWRILKACDFGAPTSRKRLFLVARCDGERIVWPRPTHGEGKRPYRTAAEIIDWDNLGTSIFERKRPLADATLRRIAAGVERFVINAEDPFFVSYAQQGGRSRSAFEPMHTITASKKDHNCVVAPTLIQVGYGERKGQAPRVPGLHKPLGTMVAQGRKHALVTAFLARHWGGMTGARLDDRPWPTLTTKGCQDQVVEVDLATAPRGHAHDVAFLMKYYGTGACKDPRESLGTLTTKQRFALVTVTIGDVEYAIVDIRMRMLTPREMFRAQGFPDSYSLDVPLPKTAGAMEVKPKKLGVTDLTFLCGNSVCPDVAYHLAKANTRRVRLLSANDDARMVA